MIAAVIPVKDLDRAKGRLASVLTASQRRTLVRAMLEDLVTTLRSSPRVAFVLVVSPDDHLLDAAGAWGAEALHEPGGDSGINTALQAAAEACAARGASSMLVLPVDVPSVSVDDIERLAAERPPAPSVVLTPGADGGTTALLASPPSAIPFRFGPDSYRLHREACARAGVACAVVRIPSLTHDLDTPDDARRVLEMPGAPRTRAALADSGFAPLP